MFGSTTAIDVKTSIASIEHIFSWFHFLFVYLFVFHIFDEKVEKSQSKAQCPEHEHSSICFSIELTFLVVANFPKIGNNDFETWLWLNVAMNKLIGWFFVLKFQRIRAYRSIECHGMNRILCMNTIETKTRTKKNRVCEMWVWCRCRRFFHCNRIGALFWLAQII